MNHDPHPNQFALLGQRRFAPFFWTQFLGAGNDNLFKFAFTVLVTYQLQLSWLPPAQAGLAIGALFILPFLLFSATSGQLTDKFDKTAMIRFVKWLEIAIMAIAALGFVTTHVPLAAGLRVPDGPAFHALRPGQVRLLAATFERTRADRRQRHGRDGHLRGHSAGQRGWRRADRAAWYRCDRCRARLPGAGCGRSHHGAVRAAHTGHRPGPRHQLEPGERDARQPAARARQHRGVPFAAWESRGCGSSAPSS